MKKLILPFTIALFSYLGMHAQAPKSFNYQGIARNSTGTPIPSQNISLKISIKEGSENGSVVYSEVQSTSTNAYGLYNISIGKGTVEQGNMEDIDWGDGNKYIQVQIDPEGGNDYVNLGTTQLLSVPYALYANNGTPGPQGDTGPQGPQGPQGDTGESAYETWLGLGNTGTEQDFIESMKGSWMVQGSTDKAEDNNDDIYQMGSVAIGKDEAIDSVALDVKGAVRFGAPNPNANIGTNSFATGEGVIASGTNSTAMGYRTEASGNYSTAMGRETEANGDHSTAMGYETEASEWYSTAMGYFTRASGGTSTAMGSNTKASGIASTAMGSSTEASGSRSTAMGYFTKASGLTSIAMGRYTKTSAPNSFIYGSYVNLDASANGSFFIADGNRNASTAKTFIPSNKFFAIFDGGYSLYTHATNSIGVGLNHNSNSWHSMSDSTKKENFLEMDGKYFLESIKKMKLGSWNYKDQDKTKYRHYGPMAQEFYHYFGNDGIGTIGNDTTIATADIDGVMMIALQALIKENEELKETNAILSKDISSTKSDLKNLKDENTGLKRELEEMKSILLQIQEDLKKKEKDGKLK